MPNGVVTFSRRSISRSKLPEWKKCQMDFSKSLLYAAKEGNIENDGDGLLQVDFANRFIGGGVLGGGCVQEEIRFVICPELLCSRLFTECLADNEAVTIMGCERFNDYKGYGFSFEFTGNHEDKTPLDSFRRRKCTVVAIDAMPFSIGTDQFREHMLKRELNKVCFKCITLEYEINKLISRLTLVSSTIYQLLRPVLRQEIGAVELLTAINI